MKRIERQSVTLKDMFGYDVILKVGHIYRTVRYGEVKVIDITEHEEETERAVLVMYRKPDQGIEIDVYRLNLDWTPISRWYTACMHTDITEHVHF